MTTEEYLQSLDEIGLGVKCDGHNFDLIHAHSIMEDNSGFLGGYPLDSSLSDVI